MLETRQYIVVFYTLDRYILKTEKKFFVFTLIFFLSFLVFLVFVIFGPVL